MGSTTAKNVRGRYSQAIKEPIRCHGCGLLFNGYMSYSDHAPFCEQLKEQNEMTKTKGECLYGKQTANLNRIFERTV